MPNGILNHWQMAGLSLIATTHGGGYSHVTTRANLQIREIAAENGPGLLEAIQDLGLTARGSGADNIRNVTGSPTAGIDPQELLDTRPYARALAPPHPQQRARSSACRASSTSPSMAAARVAALEDTNDIGFQAVEVVDGGRRRARHLVPPRPRRHHRPQGFRPRHRRLCCEPEDATAVADAIVRVFIDHGDRTDRTKARLKYLLDAWGFEKFLPAVEEKLGSRFAADPRGLRQSRARPSTGWPISACIRRSQPGLNWVGVVLASGKMTAAQMRGLARSRPRLSAMAISASPSGRTC